MLENSKFKDMEKSQQTFGYNLRFCKRCGSWMESNNLFICDCFFIGKKTNLLIDHDLYNSIFLNIHCNNIDQYEHNLILRDSKEFYLILKILCIMLKDKFVLDRNMITKFPVSKSFCGQTILVKNWQDISLEISTNVKNNIILSLYQNYFVLLNKYTFSNKLNEKLLKMIEDLKDKYNDKQKTCHFCSKLERNLHKVEEEYNNILKNFSTAQSEKEKIIMKYVKTEKRVLEVQKTAELANKQRDDILKENNNLQKKLKKMHDDIIKFTTESKQKQTEITQFRNHIEHLKEIDNIKEIKLKGMQNRLKFLSDSQEESKKKVTESANTIANLKNECELLKSNICSIQRKILGGDTTNFAVNQSSENEQSETQSLDQNISDEPMSSEKKTNIAAKENSLLLTRIQFLENECSNLKTKLNNLSSEYKREVEEGTTVKNKLYEFENSNKLLEIRVNELCNVEKELLNLQKEKSELLTDIDAYQQREKQMLDFTEQVTDKHVQLQSKFSDMKTKFLILENNQDPLRKSVNKLTNKIKTFEQSLYSEKLKHNQECDILTKCLAEQIYYGQKLAQQLEEMEGENCILQKKKEYIIREMTRES